MRGQDPVRFALGTLTRIPVPPPTRVDFRTAAWGMALSPLIGVLLGVSTGLPLLATGPSLLSAVIAVTLGAYLTRALHWDGLADTADGLGSGKPAAAALEIMRRSDIGPFGTLAIVCAVLLQVAAVVSGPLGAAGLASWALALVAARFGLVLGCFRGRPARTDGLGVRVIGALDARHVGVAALLTTAAGALAAWLIGPLASFGAIVAAVAWAIAVTGVAARRLGGSTGDVLGAIVEGGVAASLIAVVAFS